MKKLLFLLSVTGATALLFSSCQKDQTIASSQPSATQASTQQIQISTQQGQSGANGYGSGAMYQVELSANIPSPQGGGVWLWISLYPNWDGDYSGSDCGHGGQGAASDKGDVTWHYTGLNNDSIVIEGVLLNGLGSFPTTITIPSGYGHYSGTIGTFLTLPGFIPTNIGFTQLQVAR